jgi:hypothetical protein
MAQMQPPICPRCGAALGAQQQFCSSCGLNLAPWLPADNYRSSMQQEEAPAARGPSSQPFAQPFSSAPAETTNGQWPPLPQADQPYFPAQDRPALPMTPMPPPATPPPARNRPRLRTGVVLLLVLALVILGVVSYAAMSLLGSGLFKPAPVQAPITTVSVNASVTYAGVAVTVVNVQRSQNFLDDPHTSSTGMVRVHLQAQNKATEPVNLFYNNIAHLVLPGGKEVASTYVKAVVGVMPGATQAGTVDFAVPMTFKVNQLALRLGANNEAQIDIPLTANPDLSQYEPKTTQLNGKLSYLGLDWSLVSATTQLSMNTQQAGKGMHYVTVTLAVNNTLSQTAIPGSPFDYIRLKGGSVTASPVDSTLPVSFEAGAKNTSGTVTFLVPQNAQTLTLVLLAQKQGGFDQATVDFHL